MPELPEVECMANKIRPFVEGQTIQSFQATWPRKVFPSIAVLQKRLPGQTIVRVWRRAKYLVCDLSGSQALIFHLGMSGRMEWSGQATRESARHLRAHVDFGGVDRRLWFCDARKFGRVIWTADREESLCHLGPEPLSDEFTGARLARILSRTSRPIKAALLDQALLAGLGNIYADESLFRARIHPLSKANRLDPAQVRALQKSIRAVLQKAIRLCGTSFDWVYPGGRMQTRLKAYGRTDEPCPRCQSPIARILVTQRATHFCPRCQPRKTR